MHDLLHRYGLLFVLFSGLLVGVAIYWPAPQKPLAVAHEAGRPPVPSDYVEPLASPEEHARQAQLQATADQKKIAGDRVQIDRASFTPPHPEIQQH